MNQAVMPLKSLAAAIAVLLIAGLGGFGYLYFLAAQDAPTADVQAQNPPKAPSYVSMDSFLVSVGGKSKRGVRRSGTYLQVSFNLETVDSAAVEDFEKLKPALRGKVLDVLLDMPASILHNKESREKMKQRVLETVNKAIAANQATPDTSVEFRKIYVTRFVTQAG